MTDNNYRPMIMATDTENAAENGVISTPWSKRETEEQGQTFEYSVLKTPWGEHAAEKQEQTAEQQTSEAQVAEDPSMHDTMVKIIEYMNKINGEGKTIDAEAVTQQLIEKFSDKALELLTMAVNEPSNFAAYVGDSDIKTSRSAVNALCNLSEQQTDQILSNQDNTNDEPMIFAQEPYDIAKKIYATTPWGQYAAEKKEQAATQQTEDATNDAPMMLAPEADNAIERIEATAPWKQEQSAAQHSEEQQTTENNPTHDKMVKIINYMNSINGEGKTIDAEAMTQQLMEKYPDKALELLTMAINEPRNFASYIGDPNIKTSRGALNALCNISDKQADQALLRKDNDLKNVLKTQADVNKTVRESQKTIERIKKTKPAFNIQNPLDNAAQKHQQQLSAQTESLKNGIQLRLPTQASQQKLETALAQNSAQQNSTSNSNNEPSIMRPQENVKPGNVQDSMANTNFAAWQKAKQQQR